MLNEVTVLNIREYLAATENPGKAPKCKALIRMVEKNK